MAKPKYNYRSKEFLDQIEAFAKKGLTDKEIALSIGITPQYFSEKKDKIHELSEVLTRARAMINSIVRQKYLSIGLGGIKTKSITKNSNGEIIQETESELPPNPSILNTWLFHNDEDWRKSVIDGKKLDITTNGKDIGTQLVFSSTPLSEKDMEEIKRIQNGDSTKKDSTDTSVSET